MDMNKPEINASAPIFGYQYRGNGYVFWSLYQTLEEAPDDAYIYVFVGQEPIVIGRKTDFLSPQPINI